MIVLSHRGYWKSPSEKNSVVAFQRSFELGLGTETDIRDLYGELVISHDPAMDGALGLKAMLDLLAGQDLPLAMNIKADGLARPLLEIMQTRGLTNWFTFDMSVPEMIVQLRLGLPVYTRASEFEKPPVLYDRAQGVWLDAFESHWYSPADVRAFIEDGKSVCIVSPELHGRDHGPLWAALRNDGVCAAPRLMLCTDLPEDALAYFGVAQ